MTKKDFIKIAEIIKSIIGQLGRVNVKTEDGNTIEDISEFIIDEFAYGLEDTNERFDENKFRKYIYKDNKYYEGQ